MKPKMSAAPPSASQSEALHNQSDTCVQRCPKRYQTDCEEKRDPDERQRSLTIKENELDPNAQLEKRTSTVQCAEKGNRSNARRRQTSFIIVGLARCGFSSRQSENAS